MRGKWQLDWIRVCDGFGVNVEGMSARQSMFEQRGLKDRQHWVVAVDRENYMS